MKWVLGYILFMNIITYVVFAIDKKRARRGDWRIPEKRLLLLSLFGGSIGGWRGMKDFYHKVNKTSFRILVPLFAALQLALLYYLIVHVLNSIQENMNLFVGTILLHFILFFLLSRFAKSRR